MGCSPRAELARIHATDRFFFWPINLVFVRLICWVLSVVCMWLHGSRSSYGTMNCDIYIYNCLVCIYIYIHPETSTLAKSDVICGNL